MTNSDSTKYCNSCGETKLLSAFHKRNDIPSGRQARCKSCQKVADRKWLKDNRDYANERQRKYYHDNHGAKRKQANAYRAKDPETARQREREHYVLTKERRRQQAREKYHRNKQDAEWRAKEWERLNRALHDKRAGNRRGPKEVEWYAAVLRKDPCSYCGVLYSGEIDHIVPISKGGEHAIENLSAACPNCNRSKQNKSLLEFMLYRLE